MIYLRTWLFLGAESLQKERFIEAQLKICVLPLIFYLCEAEQHQWSGEQWSDCYFISFVWEHCGSPLHTVDNFAILKHNASF